MKKLLLLAAFGLMASPAFAQSNSATTAQTGTDNSADVTQSGGATFESTQGLDANVINATQAGASTAIITQSSLDMPETGGHEATISQVGGDGNYIELSQSFDTNVLGPAGAHEATINQTGNDNVVAGAWDGSSYDPADQSSRTDLSAVINQMGDRNRVNFQDGTNLTIDQSGADNYVQSTGGGAVDIDQDGTFNDAYSLGVKTSTMYQEGDRNYAFARGGFAGSNTSVDINQLGSDNVANLQGDPRGGESTVDQDGDYNSVVADYGSASAKDAQGIDLYVKQDAGAFGASTESNSLDLMVRGTNNTVDVDQTLTGAGQNTATIDMLSDGGMADVMQNGVGNAATITQN